MVDSATISTSKDIKRNLMLAGQIIGDVYSAYTPLVAGSGGTAGTANVTASGRFRTLGKLVFFQVDILWNNIGSYTGSTAFTLPVVAQANGTTQLGEIFAGRNTITGDMLQAFCINGTTAQLFTYNNIPQLAATHRYIINGTYESL